MWSRTEEKDCGASPILLFFLILLKLPLFSFVALVLIVLGLPWSLKANELAVADSADTRALPLTGNRFGRIFREPCGDSKFKFWRNVTPDLVKVNASHLQYLCFPVNVTRMSPRPAPPSYVQRAL